MEDLLAARLQMAFSLGFHIIFAAVGMAMPILMAASHALWLRSKKLVYYDLTKAWSKGVAIFFATGAVSGTALSFELGLLWPGFMKHAGAIIGMPFSWEGAAFFLEAIALGIFLYGWDRIPRAIHWLAGLAVGISGLASAQFVVAANAWMNSPAGFDWIQGKAYNIDPWAAMFNDAMGMMGIHMIVASLQATGFAVAGVHAFLLYRDPLNVLHKKAIRIALIMASIASLVQMPCGDLMAKSTARRQPIKLAAMEGHFHTESHAPLLIGGIPNEETMETPYAIRLPGLLSFLVHSDFQTAVPGLDAFPRDLWPPVAITHISFQIMVLCGALMNLVGLLFLWAFWRKRVWIYRPGFLKVLAALTPIGFVAIWAGWTVTEVGRQPWIIYGVMKTSQALTPMPGLVYPFLLFTGVYTLLLGTVSWLMLRQFRALSMQGPWEE